MSFGFGFALPHWQTLSGGFNPSALFVGGTAGAWYDPSDSTTLFSDTAGTTPSPTPGGGALSVVGLMLDKSQGLVLGSELVTNGDFNGGLIGTKTDGSGSVSTWTLNSTNPISGAQDGRLVITTGATGRPLLVWPVTTVAGKAYLYSFDYKVNSGAPIIRDINNGGGLVTVTITLSGSGRFQAVLTATGAANFGALYFNNSLCDVQLDNISVRELPGNHAISYNTTTARPELSARVNLLTYSENLNGTGWSTLFGGTGTTPAITSNYAAAPDGTITASRFVGTRGASNTTADYSLSASPNGTVSSGASYVGSVYIKSNTGSNQNVTIYVATGAAVQQIVAVAGSTWTRVAPAALTATTTPCNIVIGTRGGSYGGDQSLDILVWGADLRPANIGSSVPAYQRIADQYTYDSSGFPRYLVFNGTASGMYTPANLNLSATDKATVFAGVRKLSDAAVQVLAELSAEVNVNNGAFACYVQTNGRYTWISRGTASASAQSSTATTPVPSTDVFVGIGDISSDVATLRIDGAQAATSSTDQGTGNYGTYPLYIGARNNASLWFNGYLYSLIVVGAAATAAQVSSTESWINVKEGGVY